MKSVAVELDNFFKNKGLSQKQVAETMGVSAAYINALLCGRKAIGRKVADKISNLYGLSTSWLLTGEGEMLANHITNHNVVHGNATNSIVGDNNNVSNIMPNKYGDTPEIDRNWAPVVPKAMAKTPDFDIMSHVTKQLTGGSFERLYAGTANIDIWHYLDDDALAPYYQRGDCLGLKAYPKGDLRIIPGEIYAVDTHRDGLIVRILRLSDEQNILACCTNKQDYQDFVIPKSDIIRIYKKVLRFSY